MKTTIDIPKALLEEAMKSINASTKREAVLVALEEFNRRHRAGKVLASFGTFKHMTTRKQLSKSRSSREKRHEKQWNRSR